MEIPPNASAPLNLSCTASGYPLPKVEWKRSLNGKTNASPVGNRTQQDVVGDHTVTSILTVYERSVAAAGEYSCFVRSTAEAKRPVPDGYRNSSGSVSFYGQGKHISDKSV